MFADRNEIIESILLIPAAKWLGFLRAFMCLAIKHLMGEDEYYRNPTNRKAMSIFVHLRICPHPDLTKEQRKRWSSLWWVYFLISFLLLALLIYLGEILL